MHKKEVTTQTEGAFDVHCKTCTCDNTLNSRIEEIEILNKIIKKDLEEKKKLLLQNEIQLTKLQMVVKATKIGLWDTEFLKEDPFDPDHIFIWSEDFRQLLGFENEEDFPNLLGSWSSRIHPDDKEKVFGAVQAHLSDTTGQVGLDVEYRMMKKDGTYSYYKTMGTTIRDEHGRPARVVGSQLDITEMKNLINEAHDRRIEAEEANKAKSSFLSTMSHEIRTPMNAILGIAEIELMNESLPLKTRAAFEKIFISGDMLMNIINDILDLSKIEAGKMELMPGKYSVENLVNDVANLNMMRIGSKPISFGLNVDETIPAYLFGDELRIKQILNNLLSNAFKYSERGRVNLSLSEEPGANTSSNTTLVIQVEDTGQGMTKEQITQLFDEYSQFNQEANRLTEGTGLGMSITNNLIKLMSGKIEVTSELGVGSVFVVRIPQGLVDSPALGRDTSENLRNFSMGGKTHMKRMQIARDPMPYGSVLVVDDVDTNIHVAKGLLALYDLQVDSVNSGFSAIEKIRNGNIYDVIFMDHMMPKMDGVETTQQIRALGYSYPIVALTANAVVGQLDIFLENGFNDFISKPIDMRLLNAVLNKFIRDKQPMDIIEAARIEREKKQTFGYDSTMDPTKSPLFGKNVPGLDIAKGLEQFGEPYINILGSYTANMRKLIAEIETLTTDKTINKADMSSYEIATHSVKGSSYGIFANPLGHLAADLENAAKMQDIAHISQHTPPFVKIARQLVCDIDAIINDATNKSQKPIKSHPDTVLLERLAIACNMFDMGQVDLLMNEITGFQYDNDHGLVDWLQKNVELVNFDEIAQRLSKN
ncbi:MAG: ATP-binding protein [Defluviitaleaceae bacterium]|nr:ATP-binding protein [Defluviitaleaceae bacterium]